MRLPGVVLVSTVCVLAACSGEEDPPVDGGGAADAGIDAVRPDAAPGESPVIAEVEWMTTPDCEMAVRTDYTITIDASDADTDTAELTYSGMVLGCTGNIESNPATVSCPNAAPYGGSVTVRDPEGHTDVQTFQIAICTNGSAP
jgi:hypothetical protein